MSKKMNDILATFTLKKDKKVSNLVVTQKQFRFKCKRCAVLCCKLGGPELLEHDVKRIEATGYSIKDFLDPSKKTEFNLTSVLGALKTREDGSCVFLKQNNNTDYIDCSIYKVRPVLCRIYPFMIERLDQNKMAIKFIPCCKGLNNPEGKILDDKFFSRKLNEFMELAYLADKLDKDL
jgi:Fe-S-cluster containining protein